MGDQEKDDKCKNGKIATLTKSYKGSSLTYGYSQKIKLDSACQVQKLYEALVMPRRKDVHLFTKASSAYKAGSMGHPVRIEVASPQIQLANHYSSWSTQGMVYIDLSSSQLWVK